MIVGDFDTGSVPCSNHATKPCATSTPQMVRVQNPFEKLLVRSFTKTKVVETVREVGGVRIAHAQVMEVGEV